MPNKNASMSQEQENIKRAGRKDVGPISKRNYAYWWDMAGETKIIIESDNPECPIVKTYRCTKKFNHEDAIRAAEIVIADLESGRTALKKVLKS